MIKILLISIVFLITFLNSAGFDCKKASTPTEKTICSNKSLSLLDEAMRASYDYVINGYKFGYPIYDESQIQTIEKALKKEQREFIKNRETCKNNTSCISDKTEKRIKILNKKSKCNHHVCFNNLAESNILKERSDMEYIYRLLYELLKPKEREKLQKEQDAFEKDVEKKWDQNIKDSLCGSDRALCYADEFAMVQKRVKYLKQKLWDTK